MAQAPRLHWVTVHSSMPLIDSTHSAWQQACLYFLQQDVRQTALLRAIPGVAALAAQRTQRAVEARLRSAAGRRKGGSCGRLMAARQAATLKCISTSTHIPFDVICCEPPL